MSLELASPVPMISGDKMSDRSRCHDAQSWDQRIRSDRSDANVVKPGCCAGPQVQLTGKPDAIVYEEAMKMLDLPADEVLGIGDSIEHDIQGQASLIFTLDIAKGVWLQRHLPLYWVMPHCDLASACW